MTREKGYILDPLWITKGMAGIDPEYYNYILLAANKKFRSNLNAGDISKFNEIMFHSLNLNSLALQGSLLDKNFKPAWNSPKLIEIRRQLRKIYKVPDNIIEVFRNANYIFVNLLLDYLDNILNILERSSIHFVNKYIHKEKEIFFVINTKKSPSYFIWRLRFDNRYRTGQKLELIDSVEIDDTKENALKDKVKKLNNPVLDKMDSDKNIMFSIISKDTDMVDVALCMSSSIYFGRGIGLDVPFNNNILLEVYDILCAERVLPFTIKP